MNFLFIIFAIISFNANASYTYPIRSCSDFELLNRYPNDNFIVGNDINCLGLKTNSIGNFNGTLDGNGYKVELDIQSNFSSNAQYLFNSLGSNSVIKNLTLSIQYSQTHGKKTQFLDHAGLAFSNSGLLLNLNIYASFEDTKLTENNFTSGVVVFNKESGIIRNTNVYISDSTAISFSGFVSWNEGLIDNSRVVNLSFENKIRSFSGFVGFNKGVIKNSNVNSMSITLKAVDDTDFQFGGFCNTNSGTIINSTSMMDINVDLKNSQQNMVYIGGFIQFNYGQVEMSSSNLFLNLNNDNEDAFIGFRPFFGNSNNVPASNNYQWSITHL